MTEAPPATGQEYILEEGRRLSESMLWDLQRAFFELQGVNAWCGGGVPSYITTNPYIARAYARVIAAFLRDCRPVDPAQPVYIVELGAGSGRFAFHFLKALETIGRRSALKVPYTYVMTDFTEQNLSFWRAHPSLQAFVDQGLVDFARFDAAAPAPFALERSGVVLSPGTLANPMAVIANYVFDTIPQDLYTVAEGDVREALVSIASDQPEPDPTDADLFTHLNVRLEIAPPARSGRHRRWLARLLAGYRDLPSGTTFLLPVAGLACVRSFQKLSGDRMLLLVADRGYDGEAGILGQQTLGLVVHGSFSLPVNYHALGRWARQQGGTLLETSGHHATLKVSGYLFGLPGDTFGGTAEAFAQSIDEAGPDDYYRLKTIADQALEGLDLDQILALLRFSGWDARLFVGSYPTLLQFIEAVPETKQPHIHAALRQVWDHYFPLPNDVDVAFCIATLLCGTGNYSEALNFLEHSLRLHGPDPATAYLTGVCHWHAGELGAALQSFDECLALDPTQDVAREMRVAVQGLLDRGLT